MEELSIFTKKNIMKITFLGAVGEVTGSKTLITTQKGVKILLDCGMYQGKGLETDAMNRDLGFNPSEIDYLILSHAHIDHSGLIPFIYKNGFCGTIFCTPATRDLCSIMLPDSGKIQETDTETFNKKQLSRNLPVIDPIYTEKDAFNSLNCFVSIPYNKDFKFCDEVSVTLTDTGHILGGSAIYLKVKEGKSIKTICYTGDVGRYGKRILKDPQTFPQADYIITESTYGNRVHEPLQSAELDLLRIVNETCVKNNGKLIIPSFAIGRAQEMIYALDRLYSQNLLPEINVFVDSPLAISATDIFRLHKECFNEDMIENLKIDSDPFGFEKLLYIRTVDASKKLNTFDKPCIIISASGMMEAGRIKHHIANNIENKRTTILAVGYCAPQTLGARILRGDKKVSIFGKQYRVKANIRTLFSYSGHADYTELTKFLTCQDFSKIKKLFLVHGENDSREFFKNHLENQGIKDVNLPVFRETIEL